jgi:hypothetical protein
MSHNLQSNSMYYKVNRNNLLMNCKNNKINRNFKKKSHYRYHNFGRAMMVASDLMVK